jgi:hypothetical protein
MARAGAAKKGYVFYFYVHRSGYCSKEINAGTCSHMFNYGQD